MDARSAVPSGAVGLAPPTTRTAFDLRPKSGRKGSHAFDATKRCRIVKGSTPAFRTIGRAPMIRKTGHLLMRRSDVALGQGIKVFPDTRQLAYE